MISSNSRPYGLMRKRGVASGHARRDVRVDEIGHPEMRDRAGSRRRGRCARADSTALADLRDVVACGSRRCQPPAAPSPHARDRSLQLRQPAVEEVPAAGKHDDRQLAAAAPTRARRRAARRRPLRHGSRSCRPAPRSSPMRLTAGPTSTRRSAATVAATRVCTNEPNEKPASATGSSPKRVLRVRERRERVGGLADAVVERALGRPTPRKLKRTRDIAQREERLRERLRHLVVERAALQRMRMRDERDAAWRRRPAR